MPYCQWVAGDSVHRLDDGSYSTEKIADNAGDDLAAAEQTARILALEHEVAALRQVIGYLCMERGRDGEIMIGNGTLQRYDRFKIEKDETPRGGVLIRATPEQ